MTQNGEDTRGRGYRGGGGGGGHRAAGKANPPRYREEEEGRASSSLNQRGGASVRASGGSYENGNTTHHDDQLDEDGNIVGEVDYTDGEMGSVSSSFASSPQSSVGSGGGRRGVTSGGSGGNGSTQNRVRNKNESPGASFSPSSSNGAGGGHSGGTGGRRRSDGVQPIPGVSARPAGVPFGASALSKTMPNNGRGRPRGLRPRSSGAAAGTPGSTTSGRGPSFSALGRQGSAASGLSAATAGGNALARRGTPSASFREAEARAAELLAPGVPVDVVVCAAIKIESVMRVLIARGYVRRKLVSEVTAFSLIMERGIEVIKHPFSGKAKPKNVTVNFVSRKGAMQLSWGGKSGVPLETIFGVTKGIKTDALRNAVDPERADNCFSLHTQDRTIDFEVDNPWLVLLVVRALRLFLGAHYDTLPAPTFFSHLCLRPRSSGRPGSSGGRDADSPKQTMVWTSSPAVKEQTTRSTPTERTSGDSASDESGGGGDDNRRKSPWDGIAGEGDSDCGSTMQHHEMVAMDSMRYPPAPNGRAPGAGEAPAPAPPAPPAPVDTSETEEFVEDIYGEDENGEHSSDRSPGGVMALFSSGRRGPEEMGLSGERAIPRSGTSGSESFASSGGAPAGGMPVPAGTAPGGAGAGGEEAPLTASQLLATRGMTKRLNLSKKLSAANKDTGPLKGKRFDLMALPMDPGHQDRRERGASEHAETAQPKRTQGMSISIGAGYDLPEEKHHRLRSREEDGGVQESERIAVVDDLNDKLQSLRKLCVPQARPGSYRPGRAPKTMAVKHMAFFQGGSGSVKSGAGLGSVTDMWGDGVRRQYQTDMVRQKDQSVEDVHKRDTVRTAMLVNRSGVHRVTRKGAPPESR